MTAQPYQVTVTDKTNPGGQRVIRTGLSQYREIADALWPRSTRLPFRLRLSMNGRDIGCSAQLNAGVPATPASA